VSLAGQPYLITAVTWRRRPLFASLAAGRVVALALGHQHERGNVRSHAFVVMPDHVHWLVTLGERLPLSEVVRMVKSWTGMRINRMNGTAGGRVWQGGFHDRALRRDEDLCAAARYVFANPLRAGLVRSVGDYPLWDAEWL